LYKVCFEDDDLLHVGDLDTFDRVAKDVATGDDSSAHVKRYWVGSEPSRYSECLVSVKRRFLRSLEKPQRGNRFIAPPLRFPDESGSADFYKNLIPSRQV
jgi:hypothetical protein